MATYTLNLIQFPAGTWGFVGSVPMKLALVTKDGKTPTEEQFAAANQVGPKMAGLKTRSWKTKAVALRAAKTEGYGAGEVEVHGNPPTANSPVTKSEFLKKLRTTTGLDRTEFPAEKKVSAVRYLGQLYGVPVVVVSYRVKYSHRPRAHTSYRIVRVSKDRLQAIGPVFEKLEKAKHHAYENLRVEKVGNPRHQRRTTVRSKTKNSTGLSVRQLVARALK